MSSALEQLGDLGGSRISAALRAFFTERNSPTLLVIDSLDEAKEPDERLRQADTLQWRIVLTSRPNSWNQQLEIKEKDRSHCVGELQPFRYPDDVQAFIHRWFAGKPKWGSDLAAQIAQRPDLRQAATVPLILTLYCILGGGEPLPEFRRDLYTRVLRRLLSGRWRHGGDRVDADACLDTLRAWAWAGATSHTISGVGTWADDIQAEPARIGRVEQDAVDHVATPLRFPDIDTDQTVRRFIHRSLREHLVAEHVASLSVEQAAEALLPHLWYDPDWEYSAPAALAMHAQRDQVLRQLIRRTSGSDQFPQGFSAIDGCWELRRFLARAAQESSEADWSYESTKVIGQARDELAESGRIDDLNGAPSWRSSNRQCRKTLLGWLTREPMYASKTSESELVEAVLRLEPTADDMRQAREALLGFLAHPASVSYMAPSVNTSTVHALVQLATTTESKHQARKALLELLQKLNGRGLCLPDHTRRACVIRVAGGSTPET